MKINIIFCSAIAIIGCVSCSKGSHSGGGSQGSGKLMVTTFAGGKPGYADGTGTAAQLNSPYRVTTDGQGNVYVADWGNQRIRKITPAGVVSTLAGNGNAGYVDGAGTAAEFDYPAGVAVDGQGNVYVADFRNFRIRKITPSGNVSTFAGDGTSGHIDATGIFAEFSSPFGVATDQQGNVYVADSYWIRKISPSGVVTTYAGNGTPGFVDGMAASAEFRSAFDVTTDAQGNVYVCDYQNYRIRKITTAGVVSTLAGNGTPGYIDGAGANAEFKGAYGIGSDASGNVYVADFGVQRIRKIATDGMVSTFAGNGVLGFVNGLADSAEFNYPYGVAVDPQGIVYVPEVGNSVIRKISSQ